MANKLRYVIESMYEKDDKTKKVVPYPKYDLYFIHFLYTGKGAILARDNGTVLHTSRVEEIRVWEQGFRIITLNTIYYLKPVILGDDEIENKKNIDSILEQW